MNHHRQRGYTLLELSITTILAAAGILAVIQMQSHQAQLDAARSIAQIYQRLNNAAGSYMSTFYGQLVQLDPGCSRLNAQAGDRPSSTASNCAATLKVRVPGADTAGTKDFQVANGLQPTPAELARLGMLGNSGDGIQYANGLPMPTFPANHPLSTRDSSGQPAPTAFGVVIQMMCIGGASSGATQVYSKSECPSRSFDLRSLVLNLQPYNMASSRAGQILLDQIHQVAGGDAYLSGNLPSDNGELRAQGGSSEPVIINPLRRKVAQGGVDIGLPNVLAMRSGFGSSGFDQMLRADGTRPLTGDWSAGGYSISNINQLSAAGASVTGNITAGGGLTTGGGVAAGGNVTAGGSVNASGGITAGGSITAGGGVTATGAIQGAAVISTGNVIAGGIVQGGSINSSGDITAGGTISGASGVFGNVVANVTAALKATTAYISEALTVAGNLAVGGSTSVNTLFLGAQSNLGAACDPTRETLRRASNDSRIAADASVKLLVCDPASSTWVRAQADYAQSISTLTTNINNVSGSLTNINTNLQAQVSNHVTQITQLRTDVDELMASSKTMSDDIAILKSGVTKIKNDTMRWDIINVTWDPATCARTNATTKQCVSWRARNKVWRKTPWRCLPIGQLGTYGDDPTGNTRWLYNASNNQDPATAWQNMWNEGPTSYTMPMLVGMDFVPLNDRWTFEVNCVTAYDLDPDTPFSAQKTDSYWYVGVSSVKDNMDNGNDCRSGLGSRISSANQNTNDTYTGLYSLQACRNFNAWAPSFNKTLMAARFIAFTRPSK